VRRRQHTIELPSVIERAEHSLEQNPVRVRCDRAERDRPRCENRHSVDPRHAKPLEETTDFMRSIFKLNTDLVTNGQHIVLEVL